MEKMKLSGDAPSVSVRTGKTTEKKPAVKPAAPARPIEFTRPMQSIREPKTKDERYQYKSLIPDKDPINFYADFEKRPENKSEGSGEDSLQ